MKRRDLLQHLNEHGCVLKREGGSHSVFFNPVTRAVTSVPRHTEIKSPTARKICRDLEIPVPANVA
ncbi:type II toxin-antitoxin system HicA family toxin [uncultured Hymenobacter sp.]|uniref:type II toxin-antitoxin system HicA family toxin n=1 Tax=uncultured Hymenobacter sp. TaxID=170016 RepID=UPI0035CC90C0